MPKVIKQIIKNEKSITGNYLSGKKFIGIPKKRRTAKNGRFIEISGASGNNLKKVDLKIPVGTFLLVSLVFLEVENQHLFFILFIMLLI